jgi:hypothetical protein
MSIQRLEYLRNALNQRGWSIINETDTSKYGEIYQISSNDTITWGITRNSKHGDIVLTFYIIDHLGNSTHNINDIFYCEIQKKDKRLYFDKIKSQSWSEECKNFIKSLDQFH